MFPENKEINDRFKKFLEKEGFLKGELGVAVIDLNKPNLEIFGYNINKFFYPASVYKIFIGAEVLRRVEKGDFSLDQIIETKNILESKNKIFPDLKKKYLHVGEKVTLDKLLFLMLARSDNFSTNILVDLINLEELNLNIIKRYNWEGTGLTEVFLNKVKENKPYRYLDTTKVSPRHVVEFYCLVEKNELISPFVSKKIKDYLLEWRTSSVLDYLPYYKKSGYMENNLYLPAHGLHYKKKGFAIDYIIFGFARLLKTIFTKGWAFQVWVNDSGVFKDKKVYYSFAIFSHSKQINPFKKFPIEKLERSIYSFMEGN